MSSGLGQPQSRGRAEGGKTFLPCSPPKEKSGQGTGQGGEGSQAFQTQFWEFYQLLCSEQHTRHFGSDSSSQAAFIALYICNYIYWPVGSSFDRSFALGVVGKWWWLFVCLVLAFADAKRHECSPDANVFLQLSDVTWPDIFRQYPPFPRPVS